MYENNNGYYQPNPGNPVPPPPYTPRVANDPAVDAYVESAFKKSLAATIMAEFPITSIIAIFFGSTGLQLSEQARIMAEQRGVKPSGKNKAAKILGMIGKFAGIGMTIFWGIYFLIFLIIFIEIL